MERVTPGVRDALASLAVDELSGLVVDRDSQNTMRAAALEAVRRSTETRPETSDHCQRARGWTG